MGKVSVVGHVHRVKWYELKNGDIVSFHTMFEEWPSDKGITFFSDRLTWPGISALESGINYSFMRNATDEEVDAFLIAHPDVRVKRIIEV